VFSVGKVPFGRRKGEQGKYTTIKIRLAIYIYIYISSLAGERWTNHRLSHGFDQNSIFPTTQRTQGFEIPKHTEESKSYSEGKGMMIRLFLDSGISKLVRKKETVTRKRRSTAVLISQTAAFAICV